ncbi:hypothetical protein RRG08_003426 [Elysia crispata]|uniref:glutaminyl-peptide cyclotransferase n=1 Tax=Elysia crispata TaxID=231223 RepID=A0AAE1DX00_9GAST|nr:hypothetical protein RRG08_003426 [Elysia crispata]
MVSSRRNSDGKALRFRIVSLALLLVIYSGFVQGNQLRNRLQAAMTAYNSTATQTNEARCPVIMGDFVLPFLTTLMSNMDAFKTIELPPFLKTRYPQSPGNLQVRQYLKQTFQSLDWNVEEDISIQTTPFGPVQFVNVIATQQPSASTRIVLACHYDSKLFPLGYIGAMDSAVPCAILVNIARQLNVLLRFLESDITLQMVFFDGEEALWVPSPTDSLYGSRNLATVWQNSADTNVPTNNKLGTIGTFILLDLIGHPSTSFQRYFPETDYLYTQLMNLETCLRRTSLLNTRSDGLLPLFQDSRRLTDISDDHVPFKEKGVPIMHLITFPFPPTWHTMLDVEATMDYQVIDDISRILRVFLTNLIVLGAIQNPLG